MGINQLTNSSIKDISKHGKGAMRYNFMQYNDISHTMHVFDSIQSYRRSIASMILIVACLYFEQWWARYNFEAGKQGRMARRGGRRRVRGQNT